MKKVDYKNYKFKMGYDGPTKRCGSCNGLNRLIAPCCILCGRDF